MIIKKLSELGTLRTGRNGQHTLGAEKSRWFFIHVLICSFDNSLCSAHKKE